MIRFGTYTKYRGYDLRLAEINGLYRVIYDGSSCPFKDFVEYATNVFYLDLSKEQVSNAFSVRTYGIYKGYQFDICQLNENDSIGVVTDDKRAYERLNLDFRDRGVYQKEVKINELEKLWEEFTPSKLNLPMPEGIEKKKIIHQKGIEKTTHNNE